MKRLTICSAAIVALAMSMPVMSWAQSSMQFLSAVNPADLPSSKRSDLNLYMTAQEASDFLGAHDDAILIDIRTRAEVSFVGIAEQAAKNIPYMVMDDFWEFDDSKGTYKMAVNSQFGADITELISERGLSKDSPIILMCRSGSRSARAADLLGQLGYTSVYSIVDGFEGDKDSTGARKVNGWKNASLTWTYKIRPDQAY